MKTREIIVTDTDDDFDVLFRESTLTAIFMTASDYERFSDKNLNLTDQMEAVVNRIYGRPFADDHTCVGHDWWEDFTRRIECDAKSFGQDLFDSLCSLLVAEYDEWRIEVTVYEELGKRSTPMIGVLVIWSNKVLIDRKLYEWMVGKGFNFGDSAKIRFVNVDVEALLQPHSTLLDEVN